MPSYKNLTDEEGEEYDSLVTDYAGGKKLLNKSGMKMYPPLKN